MALGKGRSGRPSKPVKRTNQAQNAEDSGDDIQSVLRQALSPSRDPNFGESMFWDEDDSEDVPIKGVATAGRPSKPSSVAGSTQSNGYRKALSHVENLFNDDNDEVPHTAVAKKPSATKDTAKGKAKAPVSNGKGKRAVTEVEDIELPDRPSPVPAQTVSKTRRGASTKNSREQAATSEARNSSAEDIDSEAEGSIGSDDNGVPNEDDEWEVEEIVDHRYDHEDDCMKYRIHWLNWDDLKDYTWEPEENLANSQLILSTYKENHNIRDDDEESNDAESAAPMASMTGASKNIHKKRRGVDEVKGTKKGIARRSQHIEETDVIITKRYIYTEDTPRKRARRNDEASEVKGTRLGGNHGVPSGGGKRRPGRPKKDDRSPSPITKRAKGPERGVENVSRAFTESGAKTSSKLIEASRARGEAAKKLAASLVKKQEERKKQSQR